MRWSLALAFLIACGPSPAPAPSPAPSPAPAPAPSPSPSPAAEAAPEQEHVLPPNEATERVSALMRGDRLPEHELLIALIDVERQRVELSLDYGPRHPTMQDLARKVIRLYAALGESERVGAPEQTRAWLQRPAIDADLVRAELAEKYGKNHPAMIKAERVHSFYSALLDALDAR